MARCHGSNLPSELRWRQECWQALAWPKEAESHSLSHHLPISLLQSLGFGTSVPFPLWWIPHRDFAPFGDSYEPKHQRRCLELEARLLRRLCFDGPLGHDG